MALLSTPVYKPGQFSYFIFIWIFKKYDFVMSSIKQNWIFVFRQMLYQCCMNMSIHLSKKFFFWLFRVEKQKTQMFTFSFILFIFIFYHRLWSDKNPVYQNESLENTMLSNYKVIYSTRLNFHSRARFKNNTQKMPMPLSHTEVPSGNPLNPLLQFY